jgi:hypothetical protein
VMGESNTTKVRIHKEENLDLSRTPSDDLSRALHIFYEELLQSLITRLRSEFVHSSQLPKVDRPLTIVLAGGTAKPAGFLQKFEKMLRAEDNFPIQVAEIRMAKDPLTATAQGCYVAAMSEAKV